MHEYCYNVCHSAGAAVRGACKDKAYSIPVMVIEFIKCALKFVATAWVANDYSAV